jgi:hypothetical protein
LFESFFLLPQLGDHFCEIHVLVQL